MSSAHTRKGPVSAADAALRARIREPVVHTACGGIRGPVQSPFFAPEGARRWQSCGCEDQPVVWPGLDVSQAVDLCKLCARGTAGGPSRWARLGCDSCWQANAAAARLLGRRPAPLSRHSIGNGVAVRVGAEGAELAAQQAALVGIFRSWDELDAWFAGEFNRLTATAGWTDGRDVPLAEWSRRWPASARTSRDALRRFTGVDLDAYEAQGR